MACSAVEQPKPSSLAGVSQHSGGSAGFICSLRPLQEQPLCMMLLAFGVGGWRSLATFWRKTPVICVSLPRIIFFCDPCSHELGFCDSICRWVRFSTLGRQPPGAAGAKTGRASVGCWWLNAGHSSSSGCDTLRRPSDPPLSILCVAPTLQVSQQGAKQVGVEGAGRGSIQFSSHYPCRPRRETAVAAHIDKILDGIVEPLLDILEGLAALQHDLHHPLWP
jgi:hypothetical protein